MTQRAVMHPVRQPAWIDFIWSLRLWTGALALALLLLAQPLRAQVTLDLRDADLRNFVEILQSIQLTFFHGRQPFSIFSEKNAKKY